MPRVDGWVPLLVGLVALGCAADYRSGAADALPWRWLAVALYCLAVAALRAQRQWQLQGRSVFDALHPRERNAHVADEGGAAQPLAWSIAFLEFPLIFDVATEFGFLATFAVPSISTILHGSGAFGSAAQKRYDDTRIIMHDIGENGVASPRGSRAIERLNAIHAQYPISNSDFVYVLWVFCYEPQRWIERGWAWRRLHSDERAALYAFWAEVGERMGIKGVPPTDDMFRELGERVESRRWKPAAANRAVTSQLIDLVASWGPRVVPAPLKRWLLTLAIGSLGSPPLLTAIGQRPAPAPVRVLVLGALGLCGWAGAMLPPRPRRFARTLLLPRCPVVSRSIRGGRGGPQRQCPASYRAGAEFLSYHPTGWYTVEELGPASILEAVGVTERARKRCEGAPRTTAAAVGARRCPD
jgi:hypothetical protein